MDIAIVLAVLLSILSLYIYLLPRIMTHRFFYIGGIKVSVVGRARRYGLRAVFISIYLIVGYIALREWYIMKYKCMVSTSHHLVLTSLQHAIHTKFHAHHIPLWAEDTTLNDALFYVSSPLPPSRTYQRFSTLNDGEKTPEIIQQLLTTPNRLQPDLLTEYDSTRDTIIVRFADYPGGSDPYVEIVLWKLVTSVEGNHKNLLHSTHPSITHPFVHFYEIFPLQNTTLSTHKMLFDEMNMFMNEKKLKVDYGGDDSTSQHNNVITNPPQTLFTFTQRYNHLKLSINNKDQEIFIQQPKQAHNIALRNWYVSAPINDDDDEYDFNPTNPGASQSAKKRKPDTSYRDGTRDQCVANLLAISWLNYDITLDTRGIF